MIERPLLGDLVITGYTTSVGGSGKNVLLAWLRSNNGNLIRAATCDFGGNDEGCSIIESSLGLLTFVGNTDGVSPLGMPSIFIGRYLPIIDTVKVVHIGGYYRSYTASGIVEVPGSKFVVAGAVSELGFGTDPVAIECGIVDMLPNSVRRYNQDVGQAVVTSLIKTHNDNFVLAGNLPDPYAGVSTFLMRLAPAMMLNWGCITAGGFPYTKRNWSVIETYDYGLAVGGSYARPDSLSTNACLTKWSGSGTLQWSRSFGGTGHDHINAIGEDSQHGLITAGWTDSWGTGDGNILFARNTLNGMNCLDDLGGISASSWNPAEDTLQCMALPGGVSINTWPVMSSAQTMDTTTICHSVELCGDIEGTLARGLSPYKVICDVTVPAGRELTIEPGVRILFAGHYKFNVRGRLNAIGTAQDSIIFTRFTPQEDSVWWGIRFYDADPASRLVYCVIEYGLATGSLGDGDGGGIYCNNSSPALEHCLIQFNSAEHHGGGIGLWRSSAVSLSHCIIASNHAVELGGGISWDGSSGNLTNCTISRNTAQYGCGIASHSTQPEPHPASHPVGTSTIIWANTGGDPVYILGRADFAVTYSDIEYSWPGVGNIVCDPLFANPVADDFHLTWANFPNWDQTRSCCINAGNPASPMDPDMSRADIGALYFHHSHVCHQYTVLPDGSGDFPTIQSAVNLLADCDTIALGDGIFSGMGNRNIDLQGKKSMIYSQSGNADLCIIECERLGRGFYFHSGEDSTTVIRGITIRNGFSTENGGGVYCTNGSSPVFLECTFRNNEADCGGGIYCSLNCDVRFHQCRILDNFASWSGCGGGGVYGSQADLQFKNCIIRGNQAQTSGVRDYEISTGSGGGVYLNRSTATFSECLVDSNAAQGIGGGICAHRTALNLIGCAISRNKTIYTRRHGGGLCLIESQTNLLDCTIRGNMADGDSSNGGGVYCRSGFLYAESCTLSTNRADSGAGLYNVGLSDSSRFLQCEFDSNTAHFHGGGIAFVSSDLSIDSCTFLGNYGHKGGGIFCWNANPRISDCVILRPDEILQPAQRDSKGGGLYCGGSSAPILTKCVFQKLKAEYGGGLYCDSTSAPLLSQCTIQSCYSSGIFSNAASPVCSACVIVCNRASRGGGICMTNNSQGSFVRCTISHNGASFGGGVYLNSSDPELNTSVIAFADSGGGVMLSNGAHPLIRYCDVYGNLGGDFTGDPPETVHILSCDPQFAGPSCVNYHLSTGSCCINTGDPMLPRDPDGTMADIGAFYHDLPCDTSIRATQVTVKYNESDSTIGVYFYAPIAGQYSVWSTFDKNANYPTNFALDTTLVVPEGWNFWKDRSPLVQYKCYIVVHDCP